MADADVDLDVDIAAPAIGSEEKRAVSEVLDSGQLAAGERVDRFETEFADYCDSGHAVATSNGTTALHAALEAVGVEPGSHVITTPFSFVATANAIRFAGGVPVFADVDPETYALDPDSVEQCVERLDGIEAIVPVHLYGLPADVGRLRAIADRHDLALVEDAAQAHGARYDGRPVGSFGDAAAFSFYPTKNMTTGEGGMVTTDDPTVADRVRRFIDHGRDGGESVELGHNFRMTDIAAAIGREQLERLPGFVDTRREHAHLLTGRLADAPVDPPVEPADRRHAYNQYTIRCADRDRLRAHLDERGIDTAVYYPRCIHEHEGYESVSKRLPVAERAADEVLSLPVHPALSTAEVERIADAVVGAEVVQ